MKRKPTTQLRLKPLTKSRPHLVPPAVNSLKHWLVHKKVPSDSRTSEISLNWFQCNFNFFIAFHFYFIHSNYFNGNIIPFWFSSSYAFTEWWRWFRIDVCETERLPIQNRIYSRVSLFTLTFLFNLTKKFNLMKWCFVPVCCSCQYFL